MHKKLYKRVLQFEIISENSACLFMKGTVAHLKWSFFAEGFYQPTVFCSNQADPNAQDYTGRTPLMYACMERAGVQVAETLLAAGADPCMEDCSGVSALVHAINAQHQPTVQVSQDDKGRIIIQLVLFPSNLLCSS